MGYIVGAGEDGGRQGIYTRVKCFPLYSLLLALNVTHVDLLSLDVEGAELQVRPKCLPKCHRWCFERGLGSRYASLEMTEVTL